MPTPVETIFAAKAAIAQQNELEAASEQVVDAYVRAYNQIASHVGELSALCHKYGKTALLANLPAETREAIEVSIVAMQDLYTACSPFPFPDLPLEPVLSTGPEAE